MKLVFVLSSASILAMIAMIHLYWAFGGKWGVEAAIPRKEGESKPSFVPGPAATLVVALLILSAAFLLLVQGGYLFGFQANVITLWGCVICAAVFFLRAVGDFRHVGFFKKVRHSVFAENDTWLYSPLCLFLGIAFVLSLI